MGKSKRQDIRFVMPSDVSPHSSEPLLTICGDLVCFPEKKDMVSKIGVLGLAFVPESCVIKFPPLAFRINFAELTSPLPTSVNSSIEITWLDMFVEYG